MKTALALPDVENVSARFHQSWMERKTAAGITSKLTENNEELMVPYDQLSEEAKNLSRGAVNAVYAAIQEEQPEVEEHKEAEATA